MSYIMTAAQYAESGKLTDRPVFNGQPVVAVEPARDLPGRYTVMTTERTYGVSAGAVIVCGEAVTR